MKILKISAVVLISLILIMIIPVDENNDTTNNETLQVKETKTSTPKPTIKPTKKLSELEQLQECMINTATVKKGFDGYVIIPKDKNVMGVFYQASQGDTDSLIYCNILIETQRELSETIDKPIYLVNTLNEDNCLVSCQYGIVFYNWLEE